MELTPSLGSELPHELTTSYLELVKQRYGTELRSRTLATIKPQIFQALTSLRDEIRAVDDANIMRPTVSS